MTFIDIIKQHWGLLLVLFVILINFFFPLFVAIFFFFVLLLPALLILIFKRLMHSKVLIVLLSMFIWILIIGASGIVAGIYMKNDFQRLQTEFETLPKILAFEQNGKIIFAAETDIADIRNFDQEEALKRTRILDERERGFIEDGSYDNKFIIIIDTAIFKETDLKIEGVLPIALTLSSEQALEILKSETPLDDLLPNIALPSAAGMNFDLKAIAASQGIEDKTIKLAVAAMLIKSYVDEKGPESLAREFRAKKIQAYPSHTAYTLIQSMPESLFNAILKAIMYRINA